MSGHPRGRGDAQSRRTVLSTVAGIAAIGLAGCAGGGGGDDGGETTTTETTETTETTKTTTAATTRADLSEPVAVSEDDSCAVCNMKPAKYPAWNAQLSLADGERAHFCSPGCFAAYYADPGHFHEGRSRGDIEGAWVRDYDSTDLVDATAARFVLELNAERIDAPMMKNPLPFGSEDGALAYVDRYDDLTKHDVVGLGAFDVALTRKFRTRFLPETDDVASLDRAGVPDDASCAVCEMQAAKFPEWNGELSFEDGGRAHVCSPGCLGAFYADPGRFADGRTQDDVVGAWAHDYDSKAWLDGLRAFWVLETNADRIDAPMMKNPLPFMDEAGATAYVEQYDDLSAADVVALTAFDRELAATYRGKFF